MIDPGDSSVPALRIEARNDVPARPDGDYVLYWMIMYRRPGWNFSLERAIDWARSLDRPLVVLEALRCGYPWASDRIHAFMLQGMEANARRFAARSVLHYPYVERAPDEGKQLLSTLASRACVVVTDAFPCFMVPAMVAAAARQIDARFEIVDSNGLLPMRAAARAYPSAYTFRRFLQKHLPGHLATAPKPDPLRSARLPRLRDLPCSITRRWPRASTELLSAGVSALARLPIDHSVPPARFRGGFEWAEATLEGFVRKRLANYPERRNQPELPGTSGFSPYLHFGHLSVHQVLDRIAGVERWSVERLAASPSGQRHGWWGMGRAAEAFLDELVTWRELGFNMCFNRPRDYDRYASLPAWARETLEKHASDPRPHLYSLAQIEAGDTHDPLFNATQRQLLREGWFHNYLRMIWGKRILEWSRTPEDALHTMGELMNRYSLDGRNPNSYTGYFWTLGRYDRPWGPERPIFGKVRYMSSASAARKVRVVDYLERYAK
jgi:deoxyribodipyrimidine photo-lyase